MTWSPPPPMWAPAGTVWASWKERHRRLTLLSGVTCGRCGNTIDAGAPAVLVFGVARTITLHPRCARARGVPTS